jgi:hypothetical protein
MSLARVGKKNIWLLSSYGDTARSFCFVRARDVGNKSPRWPPRLLNSFAISSRSRAPLGFYCRPLSELGVD